MKNAPRCDRLDSQDVARAGDGTPARYDSSVKVTSSRASIGRQTRNIQNP